MPKTAILIVAAGKGERAGTSLPKQYEALAGRPMLRRTVQAFAGYPVQVVIGPGQDALAAAALEGLALPAPVPGGATRQESVRRGLEDADYQGHSLSTLTRIADALGCAVRVSFVRRTAPATRAHATSGHRGSRRATTGRGAA